MTAGDELPPDLELLAHVGSQGGIAGFDQQHAQARELLRVADAFVLVTAARGSDLIAAVYAVPENDTGRKLLLATIDTGRRALADRRG